MYEFYLQYFLEAINAKISEHHGANLEFNSGSPVESPSCKHIFRPGLDGTYVDMESPPIMLSECDWAPEI